MIEATIKIKTPLKWVDVTIKTENAGEFKEILDHFLKHFDF